MTLLFLLIHLPSFTVFITTTLLVFLFISESKMTELLDAFVCETPLSAVFCITFAIAAITNHLVNVTVLVLVARGDPM